MIRSIIIQLIIIMMKIMIIMMIIMIVIIIIIRVAKIMIVIITMLLIMLIIIMLITITGNPMVCTTRISVGPSALPDLPPTLRNTDKKAWSSVTRQGTLVQE